MCTARQLYNVLLLAVVMGIENSDVTARSQRVFIVSIGKSKRLNIPVLFLRTNHLFFLPT